MGEDFQLPSLEDFFEDCYEGRIPYENPSHVLFLKYEDLKDDAVFYLKRLAEFVGMPFSLQEESEGVINKIIELCSINNLKDLKVNKNGVLNKFFDKNTFFRKGEVGDWTNFFTKSEVLKMNKLMEEKLRATGLSFKLISQ
ncbi:Cytosolic sulfotransferase 1 [Bienertia sinuspersici]